MQVVLVMFRGDSERRSFSIVRDVTVIGRREDCDFRIPLGEISRKHCRLIKEGDTLRAEDLGSSNGTYVNGERVQESQLAPGDTLKVGSVVFVVQIDGMPADGDLHPTVLEVSDSAVTVAPPLEEDQLLNQTDGNEGENEGDHAMEMSADAGDAPTLDEPPAIGESAVEDASDQYDPMSVLAADPDASSLGSSMDDERIAEDLIIELESNDQAQPKKKG